MNISQNTKGNNNISEINIFESKNTVDFLPEDMNSLLDYLSDESILKNVQFSFDVPNLEKKNLKNGIDENYYDFMKDDLIVSNLVRNFDSEKSHISIMLR